MEKEIQEALERLDKSISALVVAVQEQKRGPVQDVSIWRRLRPITDDLSEVVRLCQEKNITKFDIVLILKSFELI